ncbi:MAG TPA: NAD-dependent DNA ligase LigA [Planctomycetota bacterium]|nr:NAD-dependent DNA ligase LigA [Planctomycetota bacterium]
MTVPHDLEELRRRIRTADDQYYNRGHSDLTDAEYDQLFAQLRQLESAHPELITVDSPTQTVGAPLPKGGTFATVAHLAPMGSIESLMEAGEVRSFDERVHRLLDLPPSAPLQWSCEPKLDGTSANLLYENGVFVRGLSRGDGEQGEDLTRNLRTIRNLPLTLPGPGPVPARIEIRGEVLISKRGFARLQEREETSSEGSFRNARNTVAGTLKLLDPRICKRRPLDFIAFAIGHVEGRDFATHAALRTQLAAWGFQTAEPFALVQDIDAVLAFRDELERRRDDLPYELDGIVAKIDRFELQQKLGRTSRTPRWALAYKFAPRLAKTRVLKIGAQVGRTGAVTPVAQLEPTELAGVTVRNASLHNWALLAERDIREGDVVEIQRAGDVIPEVVRVFAEQRGPDSRPFAPPTVCPTCGGPLEVEGKLLFCGNLDCKDQLVGRIVHLAGRRAFDIEGLGPKQIEQLAQAGLVTTLEHVFTLALRKDQLLELERWGERSTQNLLEQIERSKTPTLARFLHGIGIRHVGETTAKDLAAHFGSLERLQHASAEQLMTVDGVGEEVATAVVDFFASPKNKATLRALAAAGVRPQESTGVAAGPLTGRTFVFTGGLATMTRDEAKARVEALGASTAGSISKKVTDVVAGADAGSKLDKARQLGLRILDEAAFTALVAQ